MPPVDPSGGIKNKCAELLRNHSEESAHLFFVALIEEYTKFLNQKLKIITEWLLTVPSERPEKRATAALLVQRIIRNTTAAPG